MRSLKLLTCVSLLAAGAAANATPPIANQVAPVDPDQTVNLVSGGGKTAVVQEKKICRQLPSSSSRLPDRVCLTDKQWRQVEDDMTH
jgi:hypothetical protein